MKGSIVLIAAALVVVPAVRASANNCEADRCIFDQAVNAKCHCDGAKNHGQYVSCVAHVTKALAACGMPNNCKGKVTRCAARSTCGKTGFDTCTPTCNIDPSTKMGTCADDPMMACTSNLDCGACHTRRSGTCPSGTSPGSGSCCRTCPTPSCTTGPAPSGCPCTSNSDCTSANCCQALGVCGPVPGS